jgi:hypothetical protein
MDLLAQIATCLSAAADASGKVLLAPIAVLPGWLSATIVGAVTGVLLLAVYKYTSNQRAIKGARDEINANLLALKLFKDSAPVALRAQGRILLGAGRLFALSIVPMLVMVVPVTLLLGQLALWYQFRPLRPGEEAVITLKLNDNAAPPWPDVTMTPTGACEVTVGPVRVLSKREVCWNVRALERGYHHLDFDVGGARAGKELAVSDRFLRVTRLRPGWHWSDILLNPGEEPFPPDSPIRSIEIDYPKRSSWTSGSDKWMVYWFAVSMVSALCFRRLLNVNI